MKFISFLMLLFSLLAHAHEDDSMIEVQDSVPATEPAAVAAAAAKIQALTQQGVLRQSQGKALEQEVRKIAFDRIGSVSLELGSPDGLGLCLELQPFKNAVAAVSVEGCVATLLLVGTLSLNASYRYDVYLKENPETGTRHEISIGPAGGVRMYKGNLIDTPIAGAAVEGFASLEWVA
ncbi:hypothetical protein WDW86_18955 [Bdellovibrionota bacterium FG-2]